MRRDKDRVKQLFDSIAWRYDFLNHFLSLGIDVWWRKRAVARLPENSGASVLDVAVGTADLTIALLKGKRAAKVTGIDISDEMLAIGRAKISRTGFSDRTHLINGDCCSLPFPNETFDAVTIAFGIRNFEHPQKSLDEIYRVLKSGGDLVVLELSRPGNRLIRWLFDLYFFHILPLIGRLLSKREEAYNYLPASVKSFVYGKEFDDWMIAAGFGNTGYRALTFGIVTIYKGEKASVAQLTEKGAPL